MSTSFCSTNQGHCTLYKSEMSAVGGTQVVPTTGVVYDVAVGSILSNGAELP